MSWNSQSISLLYGTASSTILLPSAQQPPQPASNSTFDISWLPPSQEPISTSRCPPLPPAAGPPPPPPSPHSGSSSSPPSLRIAAFCRPPVSALSTGEGELAPVAVGSVPSAAGAAGSGDGGGGSDGGGSDGGGSCDGGRTFRGTGSSRGGISVRRCGGTASPDFRTTGPSPSLKKRTLAPRTNPNKRIIARSRSFLMRAAAAGHADQRLAARCPASAPSHACAALQL